MITWLSLVPGIHFAAQHFHAWVAENRRRSNRELGPDGTCRVDREQPSNSQRAKHSAKLSVLLPGIMCRDHGLDSFLRHPPAL